MTFDLTPSPSVIVLSGYGLNSETETLYGFTHCGASGRVLHINDLMENPAQLDTAQILAIPGGFSFGDDTGSGNAYANLLKNRLWEAVEKFARTDKLIIGICNGAQIMANLGLVPGLNNAYGNREVALTHNQSARFECRWVDLKVNPDNPSPWLQDVHTLHIPVSHGEGNFYLPESTLQAVQEQSLIALTYRRPDGTLAEGEFPFNPNGSPLDIAALTDESGRILQIMPHPERGMLFTQREDWTKIKEHYRRSGEALPEESDGMRIFRNAVGYFQR